MAKYPYILYNDRHEDRTERARHEAFTALSVVKMQAQIVRRRSASGAYIDQVEVNERMQAISDAVNRATIAFHTLMSDTKDDSHEPGRRFDS